MISSVSLVKLKVLERSTGNKKVEEWIFLPKDWNYALNTNRRLIFAKNFVILKFHTFGNWSTDTRDILILNLITRKIFWMRSTILIPQMKEIVAGRVDVGGLEVTRSQACMKCLLRVIDSLFDGR